MAELPDSKIKDAAKLLFSHVSQTSVASQTAAGAKAPDPFEKFANDEKELGEAEKKLGQARIIAAQDLKDYMADIEEAKTNHSPEFIKKMQADRKALDAYTQFISSETTMIGIEEKQLEVDTDALKQNSSPKPLPTPKTVLPKQDKSPSK